MQKLLVAHSFFETTLFDFRSVIALYSSIILLLGYRAAAANWRLAYYAYTHVGPLRAFPAARNWSYATS